VRFSFVPEMERKKWNKKYLLSRADTQFVSYICTENDRLSTRGCNSVSKDYIQEQQCFKDVKIQPGSTFKL
jgi:hypothetical protein